MPIVIRLKQDLQGSHIHVRVFMKNSVLPDDDCTFQLTGELVMDVGQWQLFGAALLIGSRRMQGQLIVEVPDDKKVIEQLTQLEEDKPNAGG